MGVGLVDVDLVDVGLDRIDLVDVDLEDVVELEELDLVDEA